MQMNIRALLQKANLIGRINNLEKASSVKPLDARPYGGLTTFESRQKFPIPYYDHLRYLSKRNTSLRTIHHVLQDKILERDPEFIPRFGSKCMECGKEFENQTDICDCGGMTREPDQAQLTLIKEFFKDCNDNDQSFKAVLRECEDNLNTLDDAFLVITKKYYFNSDNELTFSQVREILSLDPEWMNFDLDDKMRQGMTHWTCVEHRVLHDEEGVCPECGKPLFPVWYIYDEGSQPMPYLKDEIIHWSRYSPSKTHGYPPVATVFEEAMIELNGNILLNDTYREQRPPKGILAIVTKNLASLQKFWEKEMDRVRVNPNHMPVMGIESDTGRGSAQYTALLNSVADMDVLNVSERMRESISGLYRISPMYRGSTEGVGGLNAEDIQRAVTAEPVAAAHQGYHEEVFPKLLDMFGITDWKLEFPSPYPANDDAELDKRMKETQIATMMHGMGFSIDLDDETGEFVYSGSAQPAQPDMGMGGGEEPDDEDDFQDDLLLGKDLQKGKTYIDDPSKAPKGAKVQRGPKGGYYYETGSTEDKPEKEKPNSNKNWTVVDDVEDLEGQPGIYFRVESYGGAEADVDKMRSVIGSDQIDRECDLCGATMDLDDLEAGCPECGNEASQANRYAKLIDDFDLIPNEEGDYELPGLLAFENHSAAYEYAQNVPGAEIVAYKGDELYHGMQEPDTGWDEFLIDPHTRYRSAANVTKKEKSDADLWNILGRPLEKARKYISDPSQAPKGVKVQRGKKGGYYYEAKPVRTSLKTQPDEVKRAVKDKYKEGLNAEQIARELEDEHGVKVHPETVNRFLEREGISVRPKRETVSRKDVETQQKTIEEQAKQIEDMSSKLKALKGDVDFYKEKYTALDKENAAMKQEIANLRAMYEALKKPDGEATEEEAQQKKTKKIVSDYENTIRDQTFESCGVFGVDGKHLLHKDGERAYITFTPEEASNFKGAIFTHNHPNGRSFSKEDVSIACRTGMKELRAITPQSKGKTYILRMKDGTNMSPDIWDKIEPSFNKNNKEIHDEFSNKIRSGDMTIDEANAKHYDEMWSRVAEDVPEIEYISD